MPFAFLPGEVLGSGTGSLQPRRHGKPHRRPMESHDDEAHRSSVALRCVHPVRQPRSAPGVDPGALRGVITGTAIPSPASSFHHRIEPDSTPQADAIGGPGKETRPHNRRPPPTYVRSARPLLRGGATSAESRHAFARLPRASAGPQK